MKVSADSTSPRTSTDKTTGLSGLLKKQVETRTRKKHHSSLFSALKIIRPIATPSSILIPGAVNLRGASIKLMAMKNPSQKMTVKLLTIWIFCILNNIGNELSFQLH